MERLFYGKIFSFGNIFLGTGDVTLRDLPLFETFMKKTAAIATITFLLLSACGGGGSSADAPIVAPLPSKLAAYVGTWSGPCHVNMIEHFVVTETPGVKDSLTHSATVDYFGQAGCVGPVIATGKYNASFTIAYVGAADASVIFTAGKPSVPSKIDLISWARPAQVYTVTGPHVVHTTTSYGMDQWCMDGGTCTVLQGTTAAGPAVNAGLYISANKIYFLEPSGSDYTVAELYSKN